MTREQARATLARLVVITPSEPAVHVIAYGMDLSDRANAAADAADALPRGDDGAETEDRLGAWAIVHDLTEAAYEATDPIKQIWY